MTAHGDTPELALKEIKFVILKNLEHTNIVKFIDSDIDRFSFQGNRENIFLVMEYIEGKTLTNYILNNKHSEYIEFKKNGRKIDELLRSILNYFYQISTAASFLHKSNIVHRDIKPENIIISNNIAKLIDFGIAQRVESEGTFKSVYTLTNLGTVEFIDPGRRLFSEKLDKLEKNIENQNWKEVKKYIKEAYKKYPSRAKKLKKFLRNLKFKVLWEKLLKKRKSFSLIDKEWEELSGIIFDLRGCSDPREDSYSIAVSLYYCMTKKFIFADTDSAEAYCFSGETPDISIASNLIMVDFEKPDEIEKTIKTLEQIIKFTLHPNSAKRWTCEQFAKAIKPFTKDLYYKSNI